jgi:hypothetical protein
MSTEKDTPGVQQDPDIKIDLSDWMNFFSKNPEVMESFFGGNLPKKPQEKEKTRIEKSLGDGYKLVEIESSEMAELSQKFETLRKRKSKLFRLYHNDTKISEELFDSDVLGSKFKSGYVKLLHYGIIEKLELPCRHVLVNSEGDIVLSSCFSSPHHVGGNLAILDRALYDLRSGTTETPIIEVPTDYFFSKKYMIARYLYGTKGNSSLMSLERGIYKINLETIQIEKIDDLP